MTVTANPPVSVLLPAYNAGRYLAEALQSVLAQTHGEIELIAIDDGSTDDTPDILRDFAGRDGRVKVISHANMGMGRSLNAALEVARHEWVARMDADDVMVPNRLERQLAFVAERPGVVVASTLVQYIDGEGKVIGRNASEYTDPGRVRRARDANVLIGFHHPAVLMRRDVIRAVGGYRPQFWPADDVDLWNRVAERDPDNPGLLVQGEYLMRYRIHGSSVCVASSRLTAQKAEWVETCMRRRRSGHAEPAWEQFLAEQAALPWTSRLNRNRRDNARTLYKSAVFHFSRKHYARFVPALLGAALLEPGFVLPRLVPQVRKRPA